MRNPFVNLIAGGRDDLVCLEQTEGLAASDKLEVDVEAGVIRNVSIISEGPTVGHGFEVDQVMMKQTAAAINRRKKGVKSRFTHKGNNPFGDVDGIEVLLGRVQNARVVGKQVRGDVTFGKYAELSPRGDLKGYVMAVADEDPEIMGLSIVFEQAEHHERPDKDGKPQLPAGRLRDVIAVDFVGDPGANPKGLLSAGNLAAETYTCECLDCGDTVRTKKHCRDIRCSKCGGKMRRKERPGPGSQNNQSRGGEAMKLNKVQLMYLMSVGLATGATEEETKTFVDGLQAVQKAILEGLTDPPADEKTAEEKAAEEKEAAEKEAAEKEAAEKEAGGEPGRDQQAAKQTTVEVLAAEKGRVAELRSIATQSSVGETKLFEWIQLGTAPEDAMKQALYDVSQRNQALNVPAGTGRFQVGEDRNRSTLAAAMSDAILLRSNVPLMDFDEEGRAVLDGNGRTQAREPHERAREFRSLTLIEMGRAHLRNMGIPGVDSMKRTDIALLMTDRRKLVDLFGIAALAMGTGDFPFIFGDVMNKSMRAAYSAAPKTWPKWVRRTTNADFKEIKRIALSVAPNLTERPEGGSIKYGTMSETRETYYLYEYAGGIILTRRAIINDDLDAFSRLPVVEANAAARKEDDVVYAVLTANANMADGVALFHAATHLNFVAHGSGAAPSPATLNAGRAAMRIQTDISGVQILNLSPKYWIGPAALEGTILQLLASEVTVGTNEGHSRNIWKSALEPVVEGRLDANDTAMWYLAGDPNECDTLEICFLEDEQVPQVAQEVDFDTGDLKTKVTHNTAAKAIDHRNVYCNDGN